MSPVVAALAAALGCGFVLWVVSLQLHDASIADVSWGPLFVVMAGVASACAPGAGARRSLVLALLVAWAARLSLYLARRNLAHGEDGRYASMRRSHGARFWWTSLFTVFFAQPLLAWLVAAPVLAAVTARVPSPLGALDVAAAAVFGTGLALEVIADSELTRFRARKDAAGRVLDTGLWRYSRHPNYFGECLLWWGFGLFGIASGSMLALAGPLLMTVLLLRVSGVKLLESTIEERRPEYARYRRRTSAFVPWPPRGDA